MDESTKSLPRMLSGAELVNKGRREKETTLPEGGLKEVIPDGSWLEAQRIKAALEARKALLAVERIDKIGSLSHAEWRDTLRLAEVTKQVGGYWQYIGHKVHNTMYLRPEEALYLIETNCLLLRHNNVTVSLQKAYKLLLDEEMPLFKYKVYASLSRVGHKVLRHEKHELNNSSDGGKQVFAKDEESAKPVAVEDANNENKSEIFTGKENTVMSNNKENMDHTSKENILGKQKESTTPMDVEHVINSSKHYVTPNQENEPMESPTAMAIDQNGNENIPDLSAHAVAIKTTTNQLLAAFTIDEHGVIRANNPGDSNTIDRNITSITDISAAEKRNKTNSYTQHMIECCRVKYKKIKNRKFKSSDPQSIREKFKIIPELSGLHKVTIKVPQEEYLPRNIFLNNTSYVLNLESLRTKPSQPSASNSSVSPSPCLRIGNSTSVSPRGPSRPTETHFFPRGHRYPRPQQPFAYPHFTPFQFPHMFQRPLFIPTARYTQFHSAQNFTPNRFRFFNAQHPNMYPSRGSGQPWNRPYYEMRTSHLNIIKDCAKKLRNLPSPPQDSITCLKSLVQRFNEIYDEKMIMNSAFDIIDVDYENIETIELNDDDDEVAPNRQRKEDKTFDEYLKTIKELAARLEALKRKNKITSKQKRSFSNLLRNFNETYGTDCYLDSAGEVVDRKLVVLDSSSDTDVVINDNAEAHKRKRKLVRNPFHAMKRLKGNDGASNSDEVAQLGSDDNSNSVAEVISKYREDSASRHSLMKHFDEKWLPNDDDFGKALPCSKVEAQLLDIIRFDDHIEEINWMEAKMKVCRLMESHYQFYKESELCRSDTTAESISTPLIGTDENRANDPLKIWESLRIIPANTDIEETRLRVDFDVYNRDVQNFKKSERPIPHFRIVCVEESSPFLCGAEVKALHSKYNDNVSIIFAVVGLGSITYLKINPTELPVLLGNE